MPTPPSSGSATPAVTYKHALTAVERQRSQLDKLLKDPQKAAYIPPPPKEKTIRPAREMMKNVQGSSAGAGSGEFHVYKAGRRREYERLKIIEEQATKEAEIAEFERKRREAEEVANAKTAKNRAKRQKKKERAKASRDTGKEEGRSLQTKSAEVLPDAPLKKRRLVNGAELVFKKPGEGSDDGSDDEEGPVPAQDSNDEEQPALPETREQHRVVETNRVTIVEDD